jgi:protein phosphatase
MNISSLLKEARIVQSKTFEKTLDNSIDLLRREKGKIGNLTISGHLVEVEPLGEALVIGDLHGDIDSLIYIFKSSKFVEKMVSCKDAILIFLGDYGDRGAFSAEVYNVILKLKLAFPEQTVLLRGNHEGPSYLIACPHDLPFQFKARFKRDWMDIYKKTRDLFDYFYNAVLVEERYLMLHGGLSPEINTPQDLALAHKMYPASKLFEDFLWSDPNDVILDVLDSPRGAGKLFGKNVSENVLEKLKVKILVRGHEKCEKGFKFNHDYRVLTLFSTKGFPYFNESGAYLQLQLSEKRKNAEQLIPWIHKF